MINDMETILYMLQNKNSGFLPQTRHSLNNNNSYKDLSIITEEGRTPIACMLLTIWGNLQLSLCL